MMIESGDEADVATGDKLGGMMVPRGKAHKVINHTVINGDGEDGIPCVLKQWFIFLGPFSFFFVCSGSSEAAVCGRESDAV